MVRLPIRLVPRRDNLGLQISIMLIFTIASLWWTSSMIQNIWLADHAPHAENDVNFLKLLFGLALACFGGFKLLSMIAKVLPGSPYYHLEISRDGLLMRTLWGEESYAWNALSPFEWILPEGRGEGESHAHYVVALRPAEARHADAQERYRRALLRCKADDFGTDDAAANADDLVMWLNTLRDQALQGLLSAHSDVDVPLGLRSSLWRSPALIPSHPDTVV